MEISAISTKLRSSILLTTFMGMAAAVLYGPFVARKRGTGLGTRLDCRGSRNQSVTLSEIDAGAPGLIGSGYRGARAVVVS